MCQVGGLIDERGRHDADSRQRSPGQRRKTADLVLDGKRGVVKPSSPRRTRGTAVVLPIFNLLEETSANKTVRADSLLLTWPDRLRRSAPGHQRRGPCGNLLLALPAPARPGRAGAGCAPATPAGETT